MAEHENDTTAAVRQLLEQIEGTSPEVEQVRAMVQRLDRSVRRAECQPEEASPREVERLGKAGGGEFGD